ncbi:MAG: S9 family peptidase [Candidatus Nanoarchaeia archaeon]|nr:S9 family peptidase [Candidatus Nanoarchaeia archaeon]
MAKYSIQDFLEIKGCGNASISPDGTNVSFLNNDTGTNQIYIIPIGGGEKEQLTDFKESIFFQRFSPVENKIIFGLDEGGNERIKFYLLDINTKKIKLLTENDATRRFGNISKEGKFISYSSNERNGVDFDVYLMNIETFEKELIFSEGEWCDALAFSPEGNYLVVSQAYSNIDNNLFLIDLNTKTFRNITPHKGNAVYDQIAWVDESGFYLASDQDREIKELFFYDLNKNELVRKLKYEWEINFIGINWKSSILTIMTNEDGYFKLRFYNPKTLKILDLVIPIEGNPVGPGFSKDDKYLVFFLQSSTKTQDVWVWNRENNQIKKLTNSYCKIPEEVFVNEELIRYKSFDGLEIPAYLYLPKERKGKIPAIVYLHGGPEAQFYPAFVRIFQYFLHEGYAVIAPNVRGSTGYGKTYQSLDDREKRLDSVKDLEWLHKALEQRGDIDTSKLALFGGSYGGYMVLAGLTFQPNLWAVGVDEVGIANFITFLENTSAYRRKLREAEYGYLDTQRKMLKEISPLTHLNNVKSPLFIIHGKNDPRVPLIEAEQMYSKLKELGRDVELLVYDDEGHGLSKLKNRLDAYPKVVEFLNKHLKN